MALGPVQEISDDEVGRIFGQAYRTHIGDLTKRKITTDESYDRFTDWFKKTTGVTIKGREGENQNIETWLLFFDTDSQQIQFKLQWLCV